MASKLWDWFCARPYDGHMTRRYVYTGAPGFTYIEPRWNLNGKPGLLWWPIILVHWLTVLCFLLCFPFAVLAAGVIVLGFGLAAIGLLAFVGHDLYSQSPWYLAAFLAMAVVVVALEWWQDEKKKGWK